ncbi:MAG TPA: response regulator transcription factor [Acidimicrobiales bacterium]|nr:response regulator transcription factor [Acidimicrobiales bacterium]
MAAQKVLLVDNEDDFRFMLRAYLRVRGGTEVVAEASDGSAAIALARDLRPDLIILDHRMEPLDGEAALPFLREVATAAGIVVYSAYVPDDGSAHRLIDLGADAVVDKSADLGGMEVALRRASRRWISRPGSSVR